MRDGVPVGQAVDTISQISSGLNKEVALHIMRRLSQGKQLADGMRLWFSRATIEIIRAGESSGTLEQTMASALESLGQQSSAVGGLVSAMVYPLTVFVAALAMVCSNVPLLSPARIISIVARENHKRIPSASCLP